LNDKVLLRKINIKKRHSQYRDEKGMRTNRQRERRRERERNTVIFDMSFGPIVIPRRDTH
jgi:hypothetical protein